MAGPVEVGDVLVALGSTLLCWAVTDTWLELDGLWTIPTWLPTGSSSGAPATPAGCSGTGCAALLGDPPGDEEFATLLAGIDPGDLPVWIPSIHPERTATAGRARTASVLGLEATHRQVHLQRAALEATGFVVRRHIEAGGIPPRRIVATGGGTAVGPWVQAVADLLRDSRWHVGSTPESAALGAAFAARLVAGSETDLADGARWAATARIIEPETRWTGPVEDRYRPLRVSDGTGMISEVIASWYGYHTHHVHAGRRSGPPGTAARHQPLQGGSRWGRGGCAARHGHGRPCRIPTLARTTRLTSGTMPRPGGAR